MTNESNTAAEDFILNFLHVEEDYALEVANVLDGYSPYTRRERQLLTTVDLCTPPAVSHYDSVYNGWESNGLLLSTPDPDIQIVDVEQLSRRPYRVRRRVHNVRSDNNYDDDIEDLLLGTSLIHHPRVELATTPEPMPSPIKDDSSYKCPICLECVTLRSPVATKCGHVYCRDCIMIALNAIPQCPLCKAKVSVRKLLTIYL